jgi:hypothetical protein
MPIRVTTRCRRCGSNKTQEEGVDAGAGVAEGVWEVAAVWEVEGVWEEAGGAAAAADKMAGEPLTEAMAINRMAEADGRAG